MANASVTPVELFAVRSMRRSLAMVLALSIGLVLFHAGSSFADPSAPGYKGQAWGTHALVGTSVVSGQTAVSGMGCRAEAGAHTEGTVASFDGGTLLLTGAVNTSVDALGSPVATRTIAEVHDVNLLGGVVTADLVRAKSVTSHDAAGFHFSTGGSKLINLKVAGNPIVALPLPNTRIDILGVGHVILNEQIVTEDESVAMLSVNMIHLVVTVPGPTLDTEIIVAHAKSGLQLRAGPLGGFAYATSVDIGDTVVSGPSSLATLPCAGTNGEQLTNSVDEVHVPGVLAIGQAMTTAKGTVSTTLTRGKTTAAVLGANVANGLITADLVKAVASVQTDGVSVALGDEGSRFVNLRINGGAFGDDVPPNTQVNIPGVGTLWLRRTVRLDNVIEVSMIELILLDGVEVRIAVANASVE